jgi:hypothetical protein
LTAQNCFSPVYAFLPEYKKYPIKSAYPMVVQKVAPLQLFVIYCSMMKNDLESDIIYCVVDLRKLPNAVVQEPDNQAKAASI